MVAQELGSRTEFRQASRSAWPRPGVLLALALAVAALCRAWDYGRRFPGIDFYQQTWGVLQARPALETANIWSRESKIAIGRELLRQAESPDVSPRRRQAARHCHPPEDPGVDLSATPLYYVLMRPFHSGDYERDASRYLLASLAALVLGVVLFCGPLRYPLRAVLMLLVYAAALFDPLQSELRVWNVNLLQFGWLSLGIALTGDARCRTWRWATGGFLLGALIMFKPNLALVPALAGALWLFGRRWGKLAAAAGGAAAAVLLGLLVGGGAFGGAEAWLHFAVNAAELSRAVRPVARGNFGSVALLHEAWGVNAGGWLAAGLTLAALGACWVGRRRGDAGAAADAARARDEDSLAAGLGCGIMLVASPLVWTHYYVMLLPLVALMFRPVPAGGRGGVPVACGFAALLLLGSLPAPFSAGGRSLLYSRAAACSAAAVLLVGGGLLQLARLPAGQQEPSGAPGSRRI